jgi:pimeloyl-ACP methyl ester carboxylesterase
MNTTRRPWIAALMAVLAGCGDSTPSEPAKPVDPEPDRCATEASTSFERPFEVDAEQYPFESCAYETAAGTLHYLDLGPRDAAQTVLMVHGNPTWSFLYRNIARELVADGHRVVVPDHLGMGMSDQPATASFNYRPRSHARHLEELVIALDLQDVTFVVQDWGGPIGLDVATRQPDRVDSMLIMNTWAWSVDAADPGSYHGVTSWYQQAKQAGSLVPDFFCTLALPGQSELNAAAADPSEGAVYDAVLEAYISPHIDPATGAFRNDEPCAPMQIFAESIGDDDAFQGEVESRLSALAGKPYALLFGLSDIIFGGQRCDLTSDTPCPGTSTCACDPTLLPSRVEADCATAPEEFHVCKEPDGSVLQPFPDRFVELLGEDALVLREELPDADHMVQEYAPDRVVEALRTLIATAD